MKISNIKSKFIIPASIFIALLCMVWLGFIGMFLLVLRSEFMNNLIPPFIQNFFIFLPQMVFPFGTTYRGDTNIGNTASYITWLTVVILFSIACSKLKIKYIIPLAVLVIAGVAILLHIFINLMGWHFFIDSL